MENGTIWEIVPTVIKIFTKILMVQFILAMNLLSVLIVELKCMKNYLRPHIHWRNKGQFHRFRPGIGPEWKIDFYQFL